MADDAARATNDADTNLADDTARVRGDTDTSPSHDASRETDIDGSPSGVDQHIDQHGRPAAAPEVDRGALDALEAQGAANRHLVSPDSQPSFTNELGETYGASQWDATIDALPQQELDSLRDYTRPEQPNPSSGELDYAIMNQAMRADGEITDPTVRAAVENVQHSLERHPAPERVTVIRGMDLQNQSWLKGVDTIDDLRGATIPNGGFTSTTLGDALPPFAEAMDSHLYIDVPAGTPALYLPRVSVIPNEGELLLGRGLGIRVNEAVESGGKWHIYGEIVPTATTTR